MRIPILSNARMVDITSTGGRPSVDFAFVDVPSILVQAIVTPIGTHADGALVETVRPVWDELIALIRSDPEAIFNISPRQLEELVAASYDRAGFDEVILTPRSGDLGRDVIAVRKGWGSIRIIDQVKAYRPTHRVTANDVRALLGVLSGDPRATKGIVTTTSTFAPKIATDPFISPFIPYKLELVDGEGLVNRLWHTSATKRSGDA